MVGPGFSLVVAVPLPLTGTDVRDRLVVALEEEEEEEEVLAGGAPVAALLLLFLTPPAWVGLDVGASERGECIDRDTVLYI